MKTGGQLIKYPLTCTTHATKMAWIERAIELLRIEHNIIGKWFREGITLEEYQTLRAWVQQRIDYRSTRLTKTEWNTYLRTRYERIIVKLHEAGGINRQNLQDSVRFSPNLDDDITDG